MANKNIMDHEGKSTAQELPLNFEIWATGSEIATQSSIAKSYLPCTGRTFFEVHALYNYLLHKAREINLLSDELKIRTRFAVWSLFRNFQIRDFRLRRRRSFLPIKAVIS
jgi:hypothetical protein